MENKNMKTNDEAIISIQASGGETKTFKRLIAKGIDIETRDERGWTLLMLAIYHENYKITKLLIEMGANIEARDNTGWTPLMVAAYFGRHKIAKLFIDVGAYVNARDNEGRTALIHAASQNQTEVIALLLENDADTSIRDNKKWGRAIEWALWNRRADAFRLLYTHENTLLKEKQQVKEANYVFLYNDYILLGKIIGSNTDFEKTHQVKVIGILGRLGTSEKLNITLKEINGIRVGETLRLPSIRCKFLNLASAQGYITLQNSEYSVDYLSHPNRVEIIEKSSVDNINDNELNFMGEFVIKKEQLKHAVKLYIDTYNKTFDGNNREFALIKSLIAVYRKLVRTEF
jgi:biotin operon repressor